MFYCFLTVKPECILSMRGTWLEVRHVPLHWLSKVGDAFNAKHQSDMTATLCMLWKPWPCCLLCMHLQPRSLCLPECSQRCGCNCSMKCSFLWRILWPKFQCNLFCFDVITASFACLTVVWIRMLTFKNVWNFIWIIIRNVCHSCLGQSLWVCSQHTANKYFRQKQCEVF